MMSCSLRALHLSSAIRMLRWYSSSFRAKPASDAGKDLTPRRVDERGYAFFLQQRRQALNIWGWHHIMSAVRVLSAQRSGGAGRQKGPSGDDMREHGFGNLLCPTGVPAVERADCVERTAYRIPVSACSEERVLAAQPEEEGKIPPCLGGHRTGVEHLALLAPGHLDVHLVLQEEPARRVEAGDGQAEQRLLPAPVQPLPGGARKRERSAAAQSLFEARIHKVAPARELPVEQRALPPSRETLQVKGLPLALRGLVKLPFQSLREVHGVRFRGASRSLGQGAFRLPPSRGKEADAQLLVEVLHAPESLPFLCEQLHHLEIVRESRIEAVEGDAVVSLSHRFQECPDSFQLFSDRHLRPGERREPRVERLQVSPFLFALKAERGIVEEVRPLHD